MSPALNTPLDRLRWLCQAGHPPQFTELDQTACRWCLAALNRLARERDQLRKALADAERREAVKNRVLERAVMDILAVVKIGKAG